MASNYKLEALSNNINYAQVWFALNMLVGIDKNSDLYSYMSKRTLAELIYHTRPSLPLTEEDEANTYIFPSRNHYFNKIINHWRNVLKKFK